MINETAFMDQLGAAHRDIASILEALTDSGRYQITSIMPSPWLVHIVNTAWTAPAKRARCKHLRGARGPMPTILTVHARQLECVPCAYARARKTYGTHEDRRCDSCRALIPEGQVRPFALQVGTVLVTGGHCEACTTIVRGGSA